MGIEQLVSPTSEVAEELDRILEIGRLLSSVLTPEEIVNLRTLFENEKLSKEEFESLPVDLELGNTSVT